MGSSKKITVELTLPDNGSYITEKWSYECDESGGTIDEMLEVFEKLLICMGYCFKGHLEIVED